MSVLHCIEPQLSCAPSPDTLGPCCTSQLRHPSALSDFALTEAVRHYDLARYDRMIATPLSYFTSVLDQAKGEEMVAKNANQAETSTLADGSLAFLLDVDKTLLDNDAIKHDWDE